MLELLLSGFGKQNGSSPGGAGHGHGFFALELLLLVLGAALIEPAVAGEEFTKWRVGIGTEVAARLELLLAGSVGFGTGVIGFGYGGDGCRMILFLFTRFGCISYFSRGHALSDSRLIGHSRCRKFGSRLAGIVVGSSIGSRLAFFAGTRFCRLYSIGRVGGFVIDIGGFVRRGVGGLCGIFFRFGFAAAFFRLCLGRLLSGAGSCLIRIAVIAIGLGDRFGRFFGLGFSTAFFRLFLCDAGGIHFCLTVENGIRQIFVVESVGLLDLQFDRHVFELIKAHLAKLCKLVVHQYLVKAEIFLSMLKVWRE